MSYTTLYYICVKHFILELIQSDTQKIHNHTVVTIGTFDGVHRGHQKIIKKLINVANANNLEATILTFFPHPRMVLQQDSNLKLINTIEERIELLKASGIDNLYIYPFSKDFSRLTAQEYVETILVDNLNAKRIIIGYDHRFGRNRTASIKDLIKFGEEYEFDVEEILAEEVEEVAISSTKIRKALLENDIETANTFLGYEFFLTGVVKHGQGIGRTINFPTANIAVESTYKLIPANGAYFVYSIIDDKKVYGMLNIGVRPTVGGTQQTIEAHFFNLEKDLYNSTLRIHFLEFLRPEQKFDSVADLVAQLKKDEQKCLSRITAYEL